MSNGFKVGQKRKLITVQPMAATRRKSLASRKRFTQHKSPKPFPKGFETLVARPPSLSESPSQEQSGRDAMRGTLRLPRRAIAWPNPFLSSAQRHLDGGVNTMSSHYL